jgi:membrane fusion protein, multidrug efflux system
MKFSHYLLCLAAVAAAGAGCSRSEQSAAPGQPNLPAARVAVATVQSADLASVIEVTGTVRPVQRALLAAKFMGSIEALPITLGQPVHAGDILVKIAAGEISARLVQAQAQLNSARRDLDRERDLLAKGASTAEMVRGLEDRFTMTQAMVREAETMLSYATLRAPFDGVISRKSANAGDFASPGMTLLEIEGTSDFQVEAAVPDSLIGSLIVGSPLTVTIPARGVRFTGPIAELSSAADASAHTVLAKITVPAGTPVRSGEFARVEIAGTSVRLLLVPSTAVSTVGQLERVFVAGTDGRAILRLVKTGATRGVNTEILAGLDSGERVVIAPPAGLSEGQMLEILP